MNQAGALRFSPESALRRLPLTACKKIGTLASRDRAATAVSRSVGYHLEDVAARSFSASARFPRETVESCSKRRKSCSTLWSNGRFRVGSTVRQRARSAYENDDDQASTSSDSSASIARSVGSVGVITLACKILGLVREVMIAARFGVGWVSKSSETS